MFACGIKWSHAVSGNFGSVVAKPALKWFFHVCIARSAKLRLCECGGTNWYFVLSLSNASVSSFEISLSSIHTSGAKPAFVNCS